MLVKSEEEPSIEKQISATICWMDKTPLSSNTKYVLKHGVNDVQAKVTEISSIINTDFSGKEENPSAITLNQIGEIELKLSKPLFFDSYQTNKATGTFVLIDPKTNGTSGVGFIQ
jgi:sulfate adenylyltransferase subunit 1